MSKPLKHAALIFIIVLAAAQLVRPDRANPPIFWLRVTPDCLDSHPCRGCGIRRVGHDGGCHDGLLGPGGKAIRPARYEGYSDGSWSELRSFCARLR
jgi:hypothetical protein